MDSLYYLHCIKKYDFLIYNYVKNSVKIIKFKYFEILRFIYNSHHKPNNFS